MKTRFARFIHQAVTTRSRQRTWLLLTLCMGAIALTITNDWFVRDANNGFAATSMTSNVVDESVMEASALACKIHVNVSLGVGGYAVLSPIPFIKGNDYPPFQYTVDIVGPLHDTVFCEQIGQTLQVVVTELPTGNTCMSTITVEDKMKPQFNCTPDTVPCNVDIFSLNFLDFIEGEVFDNCDDNLTLVHSYVIQNLPCNPNNFTQQVLITWTATDDSGNSASCTDILYLRRPAINQIVFPGNVTMSCVNPNTDPANTGVPTYNGQPLGLTCQYIVTSNDQVIPMCPGSYKIIRTWTVMDWCTGTTITHPQQIMVNDDTPPVISCPPNVTINATTDNCTANYTLPQPNVTDACVVSNQINVIYTVYGYGNTPFQPGSIVNLGLGSTLITITATDPCGNSASCMYTVTVRDNTPPIPVCDQLTVALGPDGMAVIYADSLDFPIIETCGILSTAIWRMTNVCGEPTDLTPGPDVKFCCADIGTSVMVAFKVTDLAGNMNTCMFNVTVVDNFPPVVECKDITVSVTGSGSVVITPDDVEESAMDNCQIISRTVTPNTFDCSDIGEHVVLLTVTDQAGNSATCTATVTVVDEVPPVAICSDITVTLDDNGVVTIETNDIDNGSFDNCAIDTLFLDRYTFDCDVVGDNDVILTVVDFGGNMSTCTATVVVMSQPPVAVCQDITVYLNEDGIVVITTDQIDNGSDDDCGIDHMVVIPDTLDCSDISSTTVMLIVTDLIGLSDTCSATVTVIDTVPPLALCKDITIMLDENGHATITGEDVDNDSEDNCSDVTLTVTPDTFDCEDVGPNVVVLTVTDIYGNASTCSATVYVSMPDPPMAECRDITVTLDPETGTVEIVADSINNGSSAQCGMLTFEVDPNIFNCEHVGLNNIVTLTVTDESGTSSTCTAIVTVLENPPFVECKNITISVDEEGNALITYLDILEDAADDCGIDSYAISRESFTCEDVDADFIVTLTVTDFSGLTATCTATVTVTDSIPPGAVCQDFEVVLDENGVATIVPDDIDNGSLDNCSIITRTVDPNEFTCEDVGPNVVVLTVTDQSGNSTTCTAIVTVLTTPPVAECQDITVSVGPEGSVTIDPESVSANAGGHCGDVTLELDEDTFTCEDVGETIVVTLTVTDANDNSSTCTANVTVVDDVPPVAICQDITIFLNENGNASINADDINVESYDNCTDVTISVTPTDFDCDDLGENVVVLTVTDAYMNSSTCTAIVTVEDDIPPVAVCENITVSIPGNGVIVVDPSLVGGESSDNCDFTMELTPDTFDCDDIGDNVVVLTVTDEAGNSSTCSAIVTVEETGGLVANCQNVTIFLNASGTASINPEDIDNGSGGGCNPGDLTYNLSQTTFNCTNLGTNIVTLTVTDQQGNTATCTAVVTVVDNLPPILTCPAHVTVDCHTVTSPENTGQFGNATATDNCGATVQETHVININACGVGTILRTFTATDASGNSATCTQLVTISNPNPFDQSDITWPQAVVNVNICNSTHPDNIPNGYPVIDQTALLCADIEITFVDQVTQNVDNDPSTPCQVITRTWTVVDNCQQNASFVFVQTVNVTDMAPPLFTNINDMTKVAGPNCTANFTLIASATDCAGVSITNNSPYGATNGANASGNYPVGETVVIFTATDGCGNISTMDVVITVTDPNPPSFQCHKIIFFMTPELEITLLAEEFADIIPGTCSDADDYVVSYSRTDPFDSERIYGCGDVGVSSFKLYFWTANGTTLIDSCNFADLDLRDPEDYCQDGLVVGGHIEAEGGEPVIGVEVLVVNAAMQPGVTDEDGRFIMNGFEEETGYELVPVHDVQHRTGVSTLDLVMIQRHLLGMSLIESPYKLIAADANRSGSVTASDVVEIRKLILGIYERFPDNTSWRFVDRNYTFPDPANPFTPVFPESLWLDSVSVFGTKANFRAVKVGDVNGSYRAQKLKDEVVTTRSDAGLELVMSEKTSERGVHSNLEIRIAGGQEAFDGLQLSLRVGRLSEAELAMISSEILTKEEWYYDPVKQVVNISWSSGYAIDYSGRLLLTIPMMADQMRNVTLSDGPVAAEVYRVSGRETHTAGIRLVLEPVAVAGDYHLYQNVPNPFSETTVIRFALPKEETVVVSIYDMTGRQVFVREGKFGEGVHELEVFNQDLGSPGIYYYTLYTPNASLTRKLTFMGN